MSYLGVDVGSSSVKMAAYDEGGRLLKVVHADVHPLHPVPGAWETDPEDVWQAARACFRQITADPAVRRDPPRALAISASGRENFPMAADGRALANNRMGADLRGAEFETPPPGAPSPEPWTLACGHPRERMDPVLRFHWWNHYQPELIAQAAAYPDWHGFLTLKLCGRNVSEPSLTARWATWDLETNTWAPARLAEWGLPERLLPEVRLAGQPVDTLLPAVAAELGLPADLLVVTGGHDLNCHGIGAGITDIGTACLISGSYENVLIPTDRYPTGSMLQRGLSVVPHFGAIPRSIYAICPTGNAVMNWVRGTLNLSIEAMNQGLQGRADPSPVMALPYLSGAMLHWEQGRTLRGAVLGLTLATQPTDIAQAFLEVIAYDHVNTFTLLRDEQVAVCRIRATGGGTRSAWWNQLKSDLLGVPLEVSTEPEPATLGAALLAAVGAGHFASVDAAVAAWAGGTAQIYQPDAQRAARHAERLETFRQAVPLLRTAVFARLLNEQR
ncbi:MAG TPA: FGGY family carbohydrate kinase [Anaerolineaceae bacterium]|nr:FGGY family carbohydrate kinase [Anaerolineaceae bacterium]